MKVSDVIKELSSVDPDMEMDIFRQEYAMTIRQIISELSSMHPDIKVSGMNNLIFNVSCNEVPYPRFNLNLPEHLRENAWRKKADDD